MTSAPASSSLQATPSFVALKIPERPRSTRVEDPVGQVADVDELRLPLGRSGREDLAAAREPARPVGEAAGRVVRPHDQTRPDDQRALAEDPLDLRLESALSGP